MMHHLYGILTDENAEHVAHPQEGRFREGRVQRPILVQFRARCQVMLRDERLGEVGRIVNVAVTTDNCGRGNGESFRVRDMALGERRWTFLIQRNSQRPQKEM